MVKDVYLLTKLTYHYQVESRRSYNVIKMYIGSLEGPGTELNPHFVNHVNDTLDGLPSRVRRLYSSQTTLPTL